LNALLEDKGIVAHNGEQVFLLKDAESDVCACFQGGRAFAPKHASNISEVAPIGNLLSQINGMIKNKVNH
jgi:hypothetical protein